MLDRRRVADIRCNKKIKNEQQMELLTDRKGGEKLLLLGVSQLVWYFFEKLFPFWPGLFGEVICKKEEERREENPWRCVAMMFC